MGDRLTAGRKILVRNEPESEEQEIRGTAENEGIDDSPRLPSSPIVEPIGQELGKGSTAIDPVESAIAEALRGATAAGQWSTVAQLARELEVRREARAGVVKLHEERAKRTR